jgi:hypothetical protein
LFSKGLVCLFYWGTWNYFELKRVDLETEVPIIDTKLMKRTHEEIDFANIYWGVQKRRGISLLKN